MKKQLAIKGHENRGTEVIEILEMLGGKNNSKWNGNSIDLFYFVDEKGFIDGLNTWNDRNIEFDVFTLEKFLEKFPYKVGDKVNNINYNGYGIITTMVWDCNNCCVKYCVKLEDYGVIAPFKWFNSHEIKFANTCNSTDDRNVNDICDDILIDQINNKVAIINLKSDVCNDEVELVLNDYEIEVRDGKTYAVKKKPKYPKTYEECCGVLGMTYDFPDIKMVSIEEYYLYSEFIRLIRCRDAYWKISNNWKPDWKDDSDKYFICYLKDEVWMSNIRDCNRLLVFPTEEMRDVFFENFKDLIEKCKNLL